MPRFAIPAQQLEAIPPELPWLLYDKRTKTVAGLFAAPEDADRHAAKLNADFGPRYLTLHIDDTTAES